MPTLFAGVRATSRPLSPIIDGDGPPTVGCAGDRPTEGDAGVYGCVRAATVPICAPATSRPRTFGPKTSWYPQNEYGAYGTRPRPNAYPPRQYQVGGSGAQPR